MPSILFNKARAYEKLGCLYLAQKGYDEVLIKKPHHTKAKESLKTDEKLLEDFKLETIRNSVQQFITLEGQSNNEIKISILQEIEQIEYGTLVRQFAYKKTAEEVKNLVIILKDIGYLTTKLGELSGELKYYTEAAVFYQYVITILDERLSAKSENEFTEKMLTDSYQQLTYIQQLIYSVVGGVPKHAPIVQVESNSNNQLLSSLRSEVEQVEPFYKKVDADNQAKVQMPLEQARNILFKLRKEVAEEIVTIESNRIQSVKADNTGAGEQRIVQQEQETPYVKETRKLFKKIATDMGNFLKKLYEESEAELGERPCEYAVIGLGSMALKQITPYSDLEFAILIEHEGQNESEGGKIKQYFKNLTHLVNFKMINLGESIIPTSKYGLDMSHLVHVAVNFDLGGKTPLGRIGGDKPYELIQTINGMLSYVHNKGSWASHIDKNLPYILENVCYVCGDEEIVQDYQAKVKAFLINDSDGKSNCQIRALKLGSIRKIV